TKDDRKVITGLEKWLIRLNIKPIHGRAYHPQTQGKEERFHRTLKTELLNYSQIKDHQHCQELFDKWRFKYNHQRPHESLDFQVPIERYEPSKRNYPETLPPIEYNSSDQIRKVCDKGFISFKGKNYKVGKALVSETVAIRPTTTEGLFNVYFCNQSIRTINLKV
ncbi:integrase core domain-containing protein, partial [Roseivirga sp.]|uniref:integrase core domain-containing protein n=1 Tax=Roseivirga sp. TaxID=1964215 RepID=UPI001B1BDE36